MGLGYIATMVAHAAVLSAEKSRLTDSATFTRWLESGQAKVILKVQSLEELIQLRQTAEDLSLSVVSIDGIDPMQATMSTWTICIGPAKSILVDRVTSHLKLL
jgi:peptidyl-tRNA hydrolase, PTH2 family